MEVPRKNKEQVRVNDANVRDKKYIKVVWII
jgi:hypothetical protein